MSLQITLQSETLHQDQQYVAHPGYTIFDYTHFPPFHIQRAKDSKLYCADGTVIIDAISSWWCKPLGHQHPAIKEAIKKQLDCFEHVMLGQTTFDVITELSQALSRLLPGPHRVFYSGDGSTAVEIAMKMSLQVQRERGSKGRCRFASLSGGYHGETLATLSLCDQAHYSGVDQNWTLRSAHIIQDIPYVDSVEDPLWLNAQEAWERALEKLEEEEHTLAAVLIEPIFQAAGGMKLYSQDFLSRLCSWCQKKGILVIADEITTGFWRIGKRLASDFASITPDFTCLGKALTGGSVAMSAVLIKESLYQVLMQSDFVHSNAYAGNAIGAAAALATYHWMLEHHMEKKVEALEARLKEGLAWIFDRFEIIERPRVIGAFAAFEIPSTLFHARPHTARTISQRASQAGVFLRPIQNTVYWCPPLTISSEDIDTMVIGTLDALRFLA